MITDLDRQWIKQYYSGLDTLIEESSKYILKGKFQFRAGFDPEKQENGYVINPDKSFSSPDRILDDEYEIEIEIPKEDTKDHNFYRFIKETSGKIKSTADRLGLKKSELHLNPKENLCVIGRLREDLSIDIKRFLDGPLLQFFYDQTWFRDHREWPRGHFSHGSLGLLEDYYDLIQSSGSNQEITYKAFDQLFKVCEGDERKKCISALCKKGKIKGHWLSFCNDNPICPLRNWRDGRAFKGFWHLKENLLMIYGSQETLTREIKKRPEFLNYKK